jgi:hypothetical protein
MDHGSGAALMNFANIASASGAERRFYVVVKFFFKHLIFLVVLKK